MTSRDRGVSVKGVIMRRTSLFMIVLLAFLLSSAAGYAQNSINLQREINSIESYNIKLYHSLVTASSTGNSTALAETCIAAIKDKSNNSLICDHLFSILAEIKDRTIVPALILILEDSETDRGYVYNGIPWVLGETGDPRAVEPLMMGLSKLTLDPYGLNTHIGNYLDALKHFRDKRSIPVLVPFLNCKDHSVETDAAEALQNMDWTPKDQETALHYHFALGNWAYFSTLGSSGVHFLIESLKEESYINAQRTAALGLAHIGGKDATQALVAEALGGSEDAYDALIHMEQPDFISTGSFFVKRLREMAAADGLRSRRFKTVHIGRMFGEPIVQSLLSMMRDGSSSSAERQAAAEILYEIETHRTAAADDLICAEFLRGLQMGDLAVVAGARRFFIERGDKEAESLLVNALDQFGMQIMDPHVLNYGIAADFLNCGNYRLENAARNWAQHHGFKIYSSSEGASLRWGMKEK